MVAVNLDYAAERSALLVGPGGLDLFDAATAQWSSAKKVTVELILPPGGGKLVRVTQ